MIWKTKPALVGLNSMSGNTLVEWLGIEFIEFGDDFLKAKMPVDHRTVQPFRILHGGASVALAETIGSVASTMCIDLATHRAVGLEINANHLRGIKEGSAVIATVTPIKIGRTVHVWNIDIEEEGTGRQACICRLTMAIVAH